LGLENEVGSIVPGKLTNFTILSDNPLTVPAANINDIEIWGTLHEGRKLQKSANSGEKSNHASLGPVPNAATFRAIDLRAAAHGNGGMAGEAGDICTLNHRIAAATVAAYEPAGLDANRGCAR
jgi:hypothetical protein